MRRISLIPLLFMSLILVLTHRAPHGFTIETPLENAEAYNGRAVAYCYKKEYDKAWDDVHKAQGLGWQVNPRLLELLREASGRQR